MLQYDRIDVSEGININKTSESKERMLCHYWYFKNIGFKFQPYRCNGCQALSMMAHKLKNMVFKKHILSRFYRIGVIN